jgi:hypothetical protein
MPIGVREGELYQQVLHSLSEPSRGFYARRYNKRFVDLGFGAFAINLPQGHRLYCLPNSPAYVGVRAQIDDGPSVYRRVLVYDSDLHQVVVIDRIPPNQLNRLANFAEGVNSRWQDY